MSDFSILALIEAGTVKEDDNTMGLIQGMSLEHAHSVANWLCLTTQSRVHLRFISFAGAVDIVQTPEQLKVRQMTTHTITPKSNEHG